MTLKLSPPWTHPASGILYARLWVPVDLQPILKRKEVRKTLGTRDPKIAMRKYKQTVARIEAEWEELRLAAAEMPASSPSRVMRRLSFKEGQALAGEFYRRYVAKHGDDPGAVEHWERKLLGVQRSLPKHEWKDGSRPPFIDAFMLTPEHNAVLAFSRDARELLADVNVDVDAESFALLCRCLAVAARNAIEHLRRNAAGDYAPDPKANKYPEIPRNLSGPAIGCEDLLALWAAGSGVAASTIDSWAGKFRMLMRFTEYQNVAELTRLDIERWRDHRFDHGTDTYTISSGDLAGVRGILGWAAQSTKVPGITENVALGVTQKVVRKKNLGSKGFDHIEARKILSATLEPFDTLSAVSAACRRWVPWLCAYSGARVGEIGQMHSSRIFQHEAPDGALIWCMLITPEDGSVKTGEARTVPLHSHLIDQGFLDYVERRRGEPLFYDPSRARGSKKGHRQADKVGENLAVWVRKIGIVRKVAPNHAWRHRFETLGRNLKIRNDIIDNITGHKTGTQAADYGDYLIPTLSEAIESMPRYLQQNPVTSKPRGASLQPQ